MGPNRSSHHEGDRPHPGGTMRQPDRGQGERRAGGVGLGGGGWTTPPSSLFPPRSGVALLRGPSLRAQTKAAANRRGFRPKFPISRRFKGEITKRGRELNWDWGKKRSVSVPKWRFPASKWGRPRPRTRRQDGGAGPRVSHPKSPFLAPKIPFPPPPHPLKTFARRSAPKSP